MKGKGERKRKTAYFKTCRYKNSLTTDDETREHLLKLRSLTRTHDLRSVESWFWLKGGKGFLAVRASKICNSLPQLVVSALSIKNTVLRFTL